MSFIQNISQKMFLCVFAENGLKLNLHATCYWTNSFKGFHFKPQSATASNKVALKAFKTLKHLYVHTQRSGTKNWLHIPFKASKEHVKEVDVTIFKNWFYFHICVMTSHTHTLTAKAHAKVPTVTTSMSHNTHFFNVFSQGRQLSDWNVLY